MGFKFFIYLFQDIKLNIASHSLSTSTTLLYNGNHKNKKINKILTLKINKKSFSIKNTSFN